jgi:hypothetical protein
VKPRQWRQNSTNVVRESAEEYIEKQEQKKREKQILGPFPYNDQKKLLGGFHMQIAFI